jgi:DNA polymerase III delta prime subunit
MDHLLKKSLNSKNVPNIILYGHHKVDKNQILYDNLKINYQDFSSITDDIKINKNIYIIHSKLIKNIKNIKNIIQINSIELKRMIFLDFDKCKKIIQNQLRVLIEKYRITTIFIFISDNYSTITDAIKSRCLSIRFPYINDNHEIIIKNYESPIHKYIKILIKIINKDYDDLSNNDIIKIKDLTFEYYKNNLSYKELLYELVNECSKHHHWTFDKKHKFIQYISESESLYIKSYRFIIHLESLLINLYYLTTNHYKINS